MQNSYFTRTTEEPHKQRRIDILNKYPAARQLLGNHTPSALFVLLILAVQVGMAAYISSHYSFLLLVASAFFIGAVMNHALFVLIHEATHNLIFKSTLPNRWIGIIANFAQGFPSAMAFRNYHLIHHKHQGTMELDADLPGPIEAKLVGNRFFTKTLWLFCYMAIQGVVRPMRLKQVHLWNGWVLTNLIAQLAFMSTMVYFFGWISIAYLLISTWMALGLHPLGARWIQEHFVFRDGQETYSYYGPLNKLMFNVGYHNEHHDLMTVPWTNLPKLRAMAPEFYDTLYWHDSYLVLLKKFLFDSKIGAHSRYILEPTASRAVAASVVSSADGSTAKIAESV